MAVIQVPWTKLVAAAKELEYIAVKHGINTALVCPVGEHEIVAMPVVKDQRQQEMEFGDGKHDTNPR